MLEELRAADVTTPAVVLKLDPNVLHHGGLGVIRSLGRLGVPVYGVHEGRWAPAASSRYLAGRVFWQPPPDDVDRIIAGLLGLARRIGRPAVLLPTDDAGAIFLAEHGGPLRDSFLFTDPPAELPRQVAGKYSLFQLCRDLGVPSPRATMAWSAGEAADFAATAGFPVIGKLATPWRAAGCHDGPPLRSTTIIHDRAELAEAWLRCTEAGLGLMLQEYLPGGPGQDWFFHGYCDTAGRCQPAFTGVKDRSYPAYAGLTSLGHAAPNTELREQLTGLLAALGFRGIVDLDLRLRPAGRAVQAARLQPAAGRAVPAVRGHRGGGRGPGRLPRPDRPADGRAGHGGRPPVPGGELRPAGRGRLLAGRPAAADVVGGLAAPGGRAGLVRPGRPAAVRPDVPAHGLAGGQPAMDPGLARAATRRGRAPLSARAGSADRTAGEWGAPQACSRRAGARREAAIGGLRGVVPPVNTEGVRHDR